MKLQKLFSGPGVLVGGKESRFFYVKTQDKSYVANGKVVIQLASGETTVLNTVSPK